MLRTLAKCAVVLAVGGIAATLTMILVLNVAAHNSSRWAMATSWPIAALSLSVTIGGWWVTRTMRQPKATPPAPVAPARQVRQNAENATVRGSRDSVAAANINGSEITIGRTDSWKST